MVRRVWILTAAEAGVPGQTLVQGYGLVGPAGTPRDIVAELHREAIAILPFPDSKGRLAGDGSEVSTRAPDQFAVLVKADIAG